MKIRIAKKVFKDPDRYSAQQRFHAAHRMYRAARAFVDAHLALMALMLKPQRSFRNDDSLDLRYEQLTLLFESGKLKVLPAGEVQVPQENINKPVYRRDGQAHNFNATPFPNTFYTGGVDSGIDKGWWEMGEQRYERTYSRKKYQIRTGGKDAGKKPKRLKRKDFDMKPLKQIVHTYRGGNA
jgi:hypothetical protein